MTDETNYRDDWYSDWYSENQKELMDSFVEENPDEWNEFLDMNRATLEENDFDYWKIVFCKEEMEQEFLDFCKEAYENYRVALEMEARLE